MAIPNFVDWNRDRLIVNEIGRRFGVDTARSTVSFSRMRLFKGSCCRRLWRIYILSGSDMPIGSSTKQSSPIIRRIGKLARLSLIAVLATGSTALAQSWNAIESRNPMGLHSLSLSVQKHEFALQIGCDESGQETRQLKMMFFGPTLPRLYGTDGQTETLLLHFTQASEPSYTFEWDVYYFDGGLGDQAWIGDLTVNEHFLYEFSQAIDIDILNSDLELIYRFPAKGTGAGVKNIWQVCGIGSK